MQKVRFSTPCPYNNWCIKCFYLGTHWQKWRYWGSSCAVPAAAHPLTRASSGSRVHRLCKARHQTISRLVSKGVDTDKYRFSAWCYRRRPPLQFLPARLTILASGTALLSFRILSSFGEFWMPKDWAFTILRLIFGPKAAGNNNHSLFYEGTFLKDHF